MIFLNPLVLFGLIATSIPVLIHLLNLKKLKKIEFSTLAFLKELQKSKIRKIKLKQWILLALRILIIAFLVMSFARPTLKTISLGGTSSVAKTTAILILDDSFSMSVISEKGSYFNQAKQVIKTIISELQEGDEIALLKTSDRNDREIILTNNFSNVIKDLNDSEIKDRSGTLHNAILKAGMLLSQSKNFNKEIYIFSDYQKSRMFEEESQLSDLKDLFTEDTRLYNFKYTEKDVFNIAITDFKINNQIFQKNATLDFSATVKNESERTVSNGVISLFINGERKAQQSFNLNSNESNEINFEITLQNEGLLEVMTEIEDDDILNDNRRYLSLYIPEFINVLIFVDEDSDAELLELALGNNAPDANIKITRRRLDQVSAMNLNNFDVVFIMGSERINNIARVKEFVNNGGKIVFMPGTNSSLSNFQKLCQELKVNVPTNIVGKLNDVSTKVSFGSVDYEHPIFVDLFQKNVKKQIESPDINYYFKTPVKSNSKTIISLLDNSVFLSETEFENGKVILFTSAPTFKCSNFPLKGIFAPLMNKLVFYLSARNKEIKDYIVGQSFPIKLVSLLGNQLLINKPNNNQEFINLDSLKQMNYFDYKNTDIAGSYSILNNNRIIENASFNTNPLESRLGKMSDSEFDEYLNKINFQGKLFTVQINDDYKKLIYSSRFGSELWRYFLLIALLLALVEMFIARSSKKDLIGLDDKQK